MLVAATRDSPTSALTPLSPALVDSIFSLLEVERGFTSKAYLELRECERQFPIDKIDGQWRELDAAYRARVKL